MKLDLSKFKKVESDGKTTVLAHPRGHQIKIAHTSLSEDMKRQLDGLPVHKAKGGMMSKPSKAQPDSMYPSGGFTEPQDMGTPDKPSKNFEMKGHPCINPSCRSYGTAHPNCRCYGAMAEGGKIESFCSSDKSHDEGCEYFKDGGMTGKSDSEKLEDAAQEVWRGTQPVPETPQSAPDMNPLPQATPGPQMPEAVPTPLPSPQMQDQSSIQSSQPEAQNPNVEQTTSQPMDQPKRQPQQAAPEAEANPVQKFQQSKDEHLQQMYPEAQAFQADLDNGHIKPQTYQDLFAQKDTLGKIGTIFGLLVGGMGAGLSHQPNMLMEMMNKQIDNDLKAQQESVQNKQNFLKINQENVTTQAQAKNLTADAKTKAFALAKVQMNMAALHKLVTDTQKMPDGPQKQQALQTLAMMNQGVQNENFNVMDRAASASAFYNTLFGDQASGGSKEQQFQKHQMGMQALGPEGQKIAEFQQERHLPGVKGAASVPLSGSDREEVNSGIEFDKQLHNYMDWAKKHPGDLNPKDVAYGRSLAAGVQGAYRQATHGGVYKEGEQNFISKIIDDDPTKFFNEIRVLPKVQAVADQHQIRMNQILKSKGFDGYSGASKSSSQSAPQEMTSKSGRPMVQKNGKWVYK